MIMAFFTIWVVGMRFNEATAAHVMHEDRIFLRPEPDNPHDPKAIRVLSGDGVRNLGHVSRDSISFVPELPSSGRAFEVHTSYIESDKAVRLILVT